MMEEIKVGLLVSYDYELLKISLPRIYAAADSIALAIDKDRRTWSGNVIDIPESFFAWVKEMDTDAKISIYEDDFYVPGLSTRENDTRERNMLAKFMGEGGWHVQVDADEYFADFPAFCSLLRSLQPPGPVSVWPRFITLFKKTGHGYLYIAGKPEYYPVATNNPVYTHFRGNTGHTTVYAPQLIVHESWSRGEEDLLLKLKNWSHNADFDVMAYFRLWQAVNEGNYRYVKDFHPFTRNFWQRLELASGSDIPEVINNIATLAVQDTQMDDIRQAASQPIWPVIREKIRRRLGYAGIRPAHTTLPPYKKGPGMEHTIKVGMLVSYDYELLKISLPRVYEAADSITLALDKHRRTWSGNTIDIPGSFFEWIRAFDTAGKIRIYEDDFYIPGLSVKDNDTRERNMLGQYMGEGGWHVQVDSDEYFRDFGAFCAFLRQLHPGEPVTVHNLTVTLFKKVDGGYLYVSGSKEYHAMATNHPVYTAYRNNIQHRHLYADFPALHESWSRSEEDLLIKLRNWSHREHFSADDYFALWKAAGKENCRYFNDFHPLQSGRWKRLTFVEGDSPEEILDKIQLEDILADYISPLQSAAAQPLLQTIAEKVRRRWGSIWHG